MTHNTKRAAFKHYWKWLIEAGLKTSSDDSLICPLCWQDTPIEKLSWEHIISGSVGGTRKTLTCIECNNKQGSELDAHLSQYQKGIDAIHGHGAIHTKMNVNGQEVVTNLKWGDGSKNFAVVGKASDPTAVTAIREEFNADKVTELKCRLSLGYAKNNFQTAVLRAAYLVLFEGLGYEYVQHEIVQVIRRRICDRLLEHPILGSLIVEIRDFKPPADRSYYLTSGDVNGVKFFLVIIRLRKATTSYVGAYLPVPADGSDEFFELMEQCKREHDGEMLKIPAKALFSY